MGTSLGDINDSETQSNTTHTHNPDPNIQGSVTNGDPPMPASALINGEVPLTTQPKSMTMNIYDCVKLNHFPAFKALADAQKDVEVLNAPSEDGHTLMHWSAKQKVNHSAGGGGGERNGIMKKLFKYNFSLSNLFI